MSYCPQSIEYQLHECAVSARLIFELTISPAVQSLLPSNLTSEMLSKCRIVNQFPDIPYNLSFTAASLRTDLARIIAEEYLRSGDWSRTKETILSSNALQSRSAASAVRMERELRQRLQTLSTAQLHVLAGSTDNERTAMAWLSVLKHSRIVYDFVAEVLRDKLSAHDVVLRPSDYESFINSKTPAHPEMASLSPSSTNKVRQVLLRMLVEADMLKPGASLGEIHRPVIPPTLVQIIAKDDPLWLAGFLFPDHEINSLVTT